MHHQGIAESDQSEGIDKEICEPEIDQVRKQSRAEQLGDSRATFVANRNVFARFQEFVSAEVNSCEGNLVSVALDNVEELAEGEQAFLRED